MYEWSHCVSCSWTTSGESLLGKVSISCGSVVEYCASTIFVCEVAWWSAVEGVSMSLVLGWAVMLVSLADCSEEPVVSCVSTELESVVCVPLCVYPVSTDWSVVTNVVTGEVV